MPHHKHGFTIIEVSLVLAIAGLILVMAFVALPALQRQTRDSKRKEDTMTFLQALKKYQQNNRGQLPKVENDLEDRQYSNYSILRNNTDAERWNSNNNPWAAFYNKYLGDSFTNPEGEKYSFLIQILLNAWYDYDSIMANGFDNRAADFYIFMEAICENGRPTESNNSRNLAIVTPLESGTYCANL